MPFRRRGNAGSVTGWHPAADQPPTSSVAGSSVCPSATEAIGALSKRRRIIVFQLASRPGANPTIDLYWLAHRTRNTATAGVEFPILNLVGIQLEKADSGSH